MHHAPYIHSAQQLQAIDHLYHIFQTWWETKTTASPEPHTIPKVTRPNITSPSQYTTFNKPSIPQGHHQSPRVTQTDHTPPWKADGVQYNFSSPKDPRHKSLMVIATITNRTRSQTEKKPIVNTYEPISSHTQSRQRLTTSVTAAS